MTYRIHVSYYIPKKNVSEEEFTNVYSKFKTDRQPLACAETTYTNKTNICPICREENNIIFNNKILIN
jgi:hypothetical protein